jgi:hypothetical protein
VQLCLKIGLLASAAEEERSESLLQRKKLLEEPIDGGEAPTHYVILDGVYRSALKSNRLVINRDSVQIRFRLTRTACWRSKRVRARTAE